MDSGFPISTSNAIKSPHMTNETNLIIDRLCEAFPACFNRSAPKPLKIGIGEELMALTGVHPALADLTRTRIRRALRFYTGSRAYWKALAKGGLRYGLDGQPAGEVTADQQAFAQAPRPKQPAGPEPPPVPEPSLAEGYVKLKLIRRCPPAPADEGLSLLNGDLP